ncbi:MAG TPA: nitrite/sulfite reductase [Tepidisphaeraceae bacterium]|jgi:sulfite reductase beta subunit-like hemoprotein
MQFDEKMTKNEHVKRAKDGLDVWDDIHRYAKSGFASIDPDDFARMRWFGIYQQKPNEGHFMWRIRISGGRLKASQLREIARVSKEYGRGFGDVTTRQCIQLHWMTIENFPDALERIGNKAGLYTQFACGDTPRNVCSCPMSGILKNEIVDIGNLPKQMADMFKAAGKELSNLPRKFKTTISGCPLHCNQPQINDIGGFGVRRVRDGVEQRGLGIMVGGGLSSTPHFGQSLRVFVPQEKMAEQVPLIWRTVCEIFRDADELRYKRIRARLKFLVADRGWEWVRDELERRLGFALEHDDTITGPRGALHTDHMGIGEQVDGNYYVGIPIERGRWTADQMLAVADVTERFGTAGSEVRLSQKQNVIITGVPKANVDAVVGELQQSGLDPHAPLWRHNLISCTGTEYCNLAVTETKHRAYDLLKYLEANTEIDSPIMLSVSGCPNSCAQYQVADIGLTGTKSLWQGEKVDAFDLCVGGRFGENPEFVRPLFDKVPSPIIHRQIEQVVKTYLAHRLDPITDDDPETFRDFIDRVELSELREWSAIPEWQAPAPKEKRKKALATPSGDSTFK